MGQLIEHQAVVRAVGDTTMTVRVNAKGCSTCGHGSGCAISRLSRQDESSALLDLPVLPNVRVGDVLNLTLPETRMSLHALLGYLVPALAFLLGALLGDRLTQSDFGTAVGGLLGFLSSLFLTRLIVPFIQPLQPSASIQASRWVENP